MAAVEKSAHPRPRDLTHLLKWSLYYYFNGHWRRIFRLRFCCTDFHKLQLIQIQLPVCSNLCHLTFLSPHIRSSTTFPHAISHCFRCCRFGPECCELWPGPWTTGRGWWGARRFRHEESGKSRASATCWENQSEIHLKRHNVDGFSNLTVSHTDFTRAGCPDILTPTKVYLVTHVSNLFVNGSSALQRNTQRDTLCYLSSCKYTDSGAACPV